MLRSAQISPAPTRESCVAPAKENLVRSEDRMQAISVIQQLIESEREKRAVLSKKYHRGVKIINTVDDALIVITMSLGAAGIGVLSTAPVAIATAVMTAPIVIAMEAGALATGFLSIVCG